MPVAEPGPDLAERFEARFERAREKRPRLSAFLRTVGLVWLVLAIPVLVLALIFVPNAARTLPVLAGTVWFLTQVAFLARAKTLRLVTIGRFCSLGAMLAIPVGLISVAAGILVGWSPQDDQASVYLAGPIEEPFKLLPLVLFGAVAWNRIRRFSASDFLLAGAAAGAGFNLAEELIRRVATGPTMFSALADSGDSYGLNYGPFTLLPGWWGNDQGIGFAGHGVSTGIVAAGIGIAVVHRGRGGWRWLIPLGSMCWVTFGHMVFNDYAGLGTKGQIPEGPVHTWVALGGGQFDRFVLLVLLIIVLLVDYRAMHKVAGQIPALPQKLPAGHAHPGIRPTLPPPPHRFTHELGTFAVALRRGLGALLQAVIVAREQRELAMGEYRSRGRARRHSALRQRVLDNTGQLAVILSGAALTGAALLIGAVALVDTVDGSGVAFLAWLFNALVGWWNGMSTAEKLLTILGLLSLFGGGGLLLTGLLGRGLMSLAMRAILAGGARGRIGTRVAQYLSRYAERSVGYTKELLKKKFKHAKDFGYKGNWKKGADEEFRKVLEAHARNPNTLVRHGSYNGRPVTLFYNPKTKLVLIRDLEGNFVSGWKVSPMQEWHLLKYGRLGGH